MVVWSRHLGLSSATGGSTRREHQTSSYLHTFFLFARPFEVQLCDSERSTRPHRGAPCFERGSLAVILLLLFDLVGCEILCVSAPKVAVANNSSFPTVKPSSPLDPPHIPPSINKTTSSDFSLGRSTAGAIRPARSSRTHGAIRSLGASGPQRSRGSSDARVPPRSLQTHKHTHARTRRQENLKALENNHMGFTVAGWERRSHDFLHDTGHRLWKMKAPLVR